MLSVLHVLGMLLTILVIALVGYFSGKKVKSTKDFATGGGKANTFIVAGIILGTLISGQATIGTSQLGFANGICSLWFAVGCCLGCLILAFPYAIPIRRSNCTTLMEIISKEFGREAEYLCSVLCSIGIFISVIAQIISATALLTTILPINNLVSSVIAIFLMAVYVIFGGVWGAGFGGIAKLIFVYISCIIGGIIVFMKSNGYHHLMDTMIDNMNGTPLGAVNNMFNYEDASFHYKNVVARGPLKDIGNGLSVALGIICTQTYAQGIWSGKNHRASINGTLLSALLVPPISFVCIMIGFFMRAFFITNDEVNAITKLGKEVPSHLEVIERSSQAFPMFVYHKMPDFLGGIALGTLLITVVGGGAGLSLGVATIIHRDIISKIFKIKDPKKSLIMIRMIILIILIAAAVIADLMPGTLINDYGFLSMGLRGTVVLLPLTASLFLKNRINKNCCLASIIIGPLAVLISKFAFNVSFDPLFIGIGICLIIFIIGYIIGPKSHNTNNTDTKEKNKDNNNKDDNQLSKLEKEKISSESLTKSPYSSTDSCSPLKKEFKEKENSIININNEDETKEEMDITSSSNKKEHNTSDTTIDIN